MTITLDRKTYGSLLEEYQPKVITSEAEYNIAIESIEKLMECGEELSPEETSLLELLSILVEMYEDSQFPLESASPQEILLHLMDARGLKQADLVDVIGSKGVVSEIVNGKRSISKAQAKALGEFFHVSAVLFI
ncbi:helix-turn-helix domain-containing protein [Anabaena sp. UHCC 0451]|uniref:helix-turn-helix domain-containing protein n=1 Tax=Anabaena sp. UHCC 0451 TaxID=2055235 RepID=UPI002B1F2794|nr:helix-turn-helix domain-containing protein [Anabaena sp. UHCC 0451]MEA5575617.1 helix-turn-helix domain-containing protein [Anabaena sp. UHCC 0451]